MALWVKSPIFQRMVAATDDFALTFWLAGELLFYHGGAQVKFDAGEMGKLCLL